MFSLVHGTDDPQSDQIALNHLFLSGKQLFEAAFDWETISVMDQDATTNERLVLKEVLHRQSNKKYVVGEEITLQLITLSTLNGNNKVDGLKIKSNSEMAKKNAIKCIVHAKIWMKKSQDASPSGHNWDDMYHYVFNKMEKYFCTTRKEEGEHETEDQDDDNNGTGQLQSGLFPGWMVFVLFAPVGPEPSLS